LSYCPALLRHLTNAKSYLLNFGRPRCQAISCYWGDTTKKQAINCDNARLEITVDLHEALVAVRWEAETCTVWADGICINQEAIEERSNEVNLMKDIFTGGFGTLIWLGQEADDSAQGCLIAAGLHEAYERDRARGTKLNILNLDEYEFLPHILDGGWMALSKLFERSWFSRIWVVREIAVSLDTWVLCGKEQLPLEILETAAYYLAASGISGLLRSGHTEVAFLQAVETARRRFSDGEPLRLR
jgi:Heterokaryon incompatibility protein (HET)